MKRRISALLAFLLMLTVMPFAASAASDDSVPDGAIHVNPLYAGVISEKYIAQRIAENKGYPKDAPPLLKAPHPYTSRGDAVAAIRKNLVGRVTEFTISLMVSGFDVKTDVADYLYEAMEHTGVPNEGDYLLWVYQGWDADAESYGGVYEITYSVAYFTDSGQEERVDAAVDSLLKELDLGGRTDVEKIRAVYDWMCGSITYDHGYSAGYTQYTCYAALINRTAVCQGYALLFYRLMLELGVDCRLIAGYAGEELHGWNIVRLNGRYFNMDTTWGSSSEDSRYKWYLKGDSDFPDHRRMSDSYYDYLSPQFLWKYPMTDGILYGDVDGDGTACTPADAMHLERYLAGWEGYSISVPETADFDGDGLFGTLRDMLVFVRYLAGWKDYLILPAG